MALVVDKDKCIGCAMCTQVCGESFQMGIDGKAEVIKESACGQNAIEQCPVEAITV